MGRNHKFFFDAERTPRARGPVAERTLMAFLETDVQGSDHVCRDLMDDLIAIEDGSDDQREFVGNAHRVTMDRDGVLVEPLDAADGRGSYRTARKHFREVLEDWEAFILDDGTDDLGDDSLLDDDFA